MSYQSTPEVTTQQILQAATALLARVGEGFTMEQLAEEAKVPRATIYRRIGSKSSLLERLAQAQGSTFTPQRDSRTRILYAARRVFGRAGLVNATMEEIADEAGVGVATVYRQFGDKEQLVWATIQELSLRPVLRELVEPSEDVASDLMRLTTVLIPAFYEHRDILRVILTGNEAERVYIDTLRVGSDRTLDQLAAYFSFQLDAGRLRPIGQPNELALLFLGLLLAFTVIGPTHYAMPLSRPEQLATLIVQTFLFGVNRNE